tara:strand:- start:238 stop:669 length:432 start_codon:yes stop_codon:yes gene_type:complete
MKVKELMTKVMFTVSPEDPVDKVFILFHFENIRHLPVLERGKLMGIVSDRDLKKVIGSRKKMSVNESGTTVTLSSRKVKNIMRRGVVTIGPEQRAADAAAIMAKRKIGALPVLKREKLVGILTATDILKAFVKLQNEIDKVGI